MSLYKTQRCRHFDEAGNPIKPFCSQGNKCRFIHPNDRQWDKLKRRNGDTPSPEHRDAARSKGKNKLQLSPGSPQRQRASPQIPQTDLYKRRYKDMPRERDHHDWSIRSADRRRDSDSWVYAREYSGPFEQAYPLKRANDEENQYPNQRQRLSERSLCGSASSGGYGNTRQVVETDKINCPVPYISERDPKIATQVSDTFHRLAKLCCEIVQDTCFLDREEDKLKAFTGLSSELSRAVPDAAMAVTPALATVITGHTRTRERLENHVKELEVVWKTLFSILEGDISKVIDSRLEHAMTLLDRERDSALRVIARSQGYINDISHDGTTGPRPCIDGWREPVADKITTLSERGTISADSAPTSGTSSEEARPSASLSLVPTQEGDLGTSLRIVLEDMKVQMDRQTRAIELLAQENFQLRSATERITPPQLVPPSCISASPRKPPIL